mgnify:CR=1 FL=1|tara:strand:+ start:367 stop:834 length:468 start_codon:yes stop_codon:yes gene_type:complete
MKVKIKKLHPDAVIPFYSKPGDAGMDIVGLSYTANLKHGFVEFKTGLSIEIPEGHVGLIFPRSSISETSMTLANSIGVIDSGYRGEVLVRFKPDASSVFASTDEQVAKNYVMKTYNTGNKIAQLVILPFPNIEFEEVVDLSVTERGTGGHGSTGK